MKIIKWINQPSPTSFGDHILPLWASILWDCLYPIIWVIKKFKIFGATK